MFSIELELYAIQSLFDIFGPNTNHSLPKHLVRKSSYFIIDINELFEDLQLVEYYIICDLTGHINDVRK